MIRFFVRPEQITQNRVTLDSDDAHHLRVVLQAKPGDKIGVLDGSGQEWPGILEAVGKTRAEARLGAPVMLETEPETQITVAQALPKVTDKMEQVLQRGTEVGVSGFWAFASERSLPHLCGDRHSKRLIRWQTIIKTAAEQAHRARMPLVLAEGNLQSVLTAVPGFDMALLAHPHTAQMPLFQALNGRPHTVLVIIGPESGFTEQEVAQAQAAGAQVVTLGPRILRTETAALVMTAQIIFSQEMPPVR